MRDDFLHTDGFIFGLTDLNPAEILIYSTIYNFSKKGGKGYTGTLEYLKDTIHESKPATIAVLQRLMDKGYLVREKLPKGRSYAYKATLPQGKETLPSVSDEEVAELVNNLNQDSKETLPNMDNKLNQSGKETLPKKDINKIGEKDIDTKKETLKKEDEDLSYLSNEPHTKILLRERYADKSDYRAYEGMFRYYGGLPQGKIELVEGAFNDFVEALGPEVINKGPSYFESYMRKKLGL